MSETIKCKITPVWNLYPKTTSDFHIYACTTMDEDALKQIKLNDRGNFVVNGEMQELTLGEEYDVELQETNSQRYGVGYKLLHIKHELPKTVEGQYAFLRTIINENYVNTIQAAYPIEKNIVDIIKNGTLDYSKLRGIGDSVFVDRIQKPVIENFEIMDALVELSPLGVTRTIIKKLIVHYGDNVALTIQKVKQNVYILCEDVSGIGFKTVDEYALKSGVEEDSPYRLNACIEYLLGKAENDGHCWLDKDTLIEMVMNEADVEYRVISDHMKSDAFVNAKDGDYKKYYIDDTRVGLYRNYYYESKIAEYVMELLGSEVITRVDGLEDRIREIEVEQGFEFTGEQREAIRTCVNNNVVLISGKGGVGKSTVLRGIIGVLKDYTYDTCSLSGKATQRIIEATGLTSQTIHRLLGYNPQSGFIFDRNERLPLDIVALDEASMVDGYIFYKLISAIKQGGKLIIIGDTEQLPPIGVANIFRDLIDSGMIPLCSLTQVHRQALKSGILTTANQIREGIQINERKNYNNKRVGELQDLILMPFERKPDIASHIIDICEKTKDRVDIMDFQVIVPMKERGDLCTRKLNLALQQIFNPSDDEGLKRNGYEYKVGDKVIKRGNDYEADNGNGLFNGTLGVVEWIDIENKKAGFKFVGKSEIIEYSQEDMEDIDMAYALTTHSNQGSEYKHGICAVDFSSYVLLSRQHIYTMLSRFREGCIFMFENEALRYAIDNNMAIERNTFLPELLVRMDKNR